MGGSPVMARDVLSIARRAGMRIEVENDDLVVTSAVRPEAAVVRLIAAHKAEILALNRAEDWLAVFHERAAIAEHDGGLNRQAAETLAMEEVLVGYMRQYSIPRQRPPPSARSLP